jgi:hypothetical protein
MDPKACAANFAGPSSPEARKYWIVNLDHVSREKDHEVPSKFGVGIPIGTVRWTRETNRFYTESVLLPQYSRNRIVWGGKD